MAACSSRRIRRCPLEKSWPLENLAASSSESHAIRVRWRPFKFVGFLDAAAEGLRDPLWGSMIGRLHLNGKISSAELATAKHWARIVANYSAACCSPRPPRTVPLDAIGGTPVDPDSATGEREVRRHERASAAWLEGRNALRLAGRDAERVVDDVCAQDRAPAGFDDLNALRAGLAALAALWSARRKASR